MTKRGKVLRDPMAGPGLLMVEGQQYRFVLDGVWKSDVPPKSGLVVDVELDARGNVLAITAVPESQLAREQSEAATAVAREKTGARRDRVDVVSLIAAVGLLVAWFVLTAASIQMPGFGRVEFTFWQVLGFLNTGNPPNPLDQATGPSAGIFGVVAIVALAGPFFRAWRNDKRAALGGLLPLVFMAIVAIAFRSNLGSWPISSAPDASGVAAAKTSGDAMSAIALGSGTYLSILASLYFAFMAARVFLALKANATQELQPAPRKAA